MGISRGPVTAEQLAAQARFNERFAVGYRANDGMPVISCRLCGKTVTPAEEETHRCDDAVVAA